MEMDLSRVIRAMAAEIAERFSPGGEAAMLQLVDGYQEPLRIALAKRMLQTALLFGDRTLGRLESAVPKSSRPREAKGFRDVFEEAIRQWVELHALSRVVTVGATLREAVRTILEDAVAEGLGESVIARLIRDRVGDLSLTNAARIARTEVHTAASKGADEAARSTGLAMVKEWASAEDGRTRLSHAIADGQLVELNEAFIVGGSRLMIPGDPAGPAREIINCRCQPLHHPVIGGEIIR